MEPIKIDMALDKHFLLPGNKQVAYLMIKLTAPEEAAANRLVQNLSFVIDRSGSMSGEKLDYTRQAVSFAIGHLGLQDHCSVVAFDDMVRLVAPSQQVENKDALKQAVQSIRSGGRTNLSGGMLQGLRQVRQAFREEQVNRILLLTDGQANEGITDPAKLVKKAGEMAAGGVTLTTFGLGEEFEEELLMKMSDAGRGNFYYIQSPDQIPGIFQEELAGLLSTVAQNLEVTIRPGEGVAVNGVLGYPFTSGEGVTVSLPDIYSGEAKMLLMELVISPRAEGAHHLLDLSLEYADVRENLALVSLQAGFEINFKPGAGDSPAENFEVIKQVELFRSAEAKEEAIRLADQGEFEAGKRVLERSMGKI
ncbi:MAG: VWA domain-containing protein [Desulfotomaculaceae bacterium]|nr:VWA domain-containing protein [Desulfotomaculaceae bacterium]